MCTAITLGAQSGERFFGRTMDFSHDIAPRLFITPASYTWGSALNGRPITDSYRLIGLGQAEDNLLGFFDGVNEKGFAAAALYFAGCAQYGDPQVSLAKEAVASVDFLHYILGKCGSVKDLPALLETVTIAGVPDPVTNTVAPLHWMAADRTGACAVIESTDKGTELIDNPIGVMANSPDLRWHMTNLRNYMNASPTQASTVQWGAVSLTPFGQGGGTLPLPGGFTSPERFVRTVYLKTHIPAPADSAQAVNACFHIMESVSIPKGAVITAQDTCDYTKYTAFINISACEYFYKTYDDPQIKTASLWQTENG